MVRYLEKVKNLANTLKGFSIKQIPRGENKKADALSQITSTSFAHLSKQVLVEELREKAIDEKEILAVVEEEGHTWMTQVFEYLTERALSEEKKKARTVHRPVPKNPQEKLTPITSPWPFYKWEIDIAGPFPEGPDKVEEVSHVLWAHHTMIKSSNGETLFSLTYGTKAVIPAEIGMPTLRTAEVDVANNNEALGISLDLLEEKREQAAIQEARSKAKMEGY
nr:reverse transcriptase domain-containing protein [Tanacetum cinerariifolium]